VLVIDCRMTRARSESEPTSNLLTSSTVLFESTWVRLSFADCGIHSLTLELEHETWNAQPGCCSERADCASVSFRTCLAACH
jgi:hypothetical protein